MELRAEHLQKSYGGVPVLRDVSFTAGEGVTCVMGPSGEGKTTLLRLLLGLERPDGGTVTGLEGRPMAAVFQEDRLLTARTALENLRFVLGPAFRETECRGLLAELGLPCSVRMELACTGDTVEVKRITLCCETALSPEQVQQAEAIARSYGANAVVWADKAAEP